MASAPLTWLAVVGCVSGGISGCLQDARLTTPTKTAPNSCRDFEQDATYTWNAERKAQITAAFLELGSAESTRVVETVTTGMDHISADWVRMSERLCRDYQRDFISRSSYEQRSACLGVALLRQRTFTTMLASADPSYAAHALDGFESVADKLEECNRSAMAYGGRRPAGNVEDAVRVQELAAEAAISASLGDDRRTMRVAKQAIPLARRVGNSAAELDVLLAAALVDLRQDRPEAARVGLHRARSLAEQLAAPVPLAFTYRYLGQLHYLQGEFSEAVAAYERAQQLFRESFGDRHPAVAAVLDNLGAVHCAQHQPQKAIELHQRALDIYGERPNETRAMVSNAWSNLGLAWAATGDYVRAIACYERALAIDRPRTLDNRPEIADTLNNLGLARRQRAQYGQAIAALLRALSIYQRAGLEPGHSKVIRVTRNLGSTYLQQNDAEQAVRYLTQAVEALERAGVAELEPSTDRVRSLAGALNDLGMALAHGGYFDEAVLRFDEALALQLRLKPTAPGALADAYSNLGFAQLKAGRPQAAVRTLRQALQAQEALPAPRPARVLAALEHLAAALLQADACQDARPVLRSAWEMSARHRGPAHVETRRLQHAQRQTCDARTTAR